MNHRVNKIFLYISKGFHWTATRSVTFFMFTVILFNMIVDVDKIHWGEKIRLLEFRNPSSYEHLLELIKHDKPVDEKKIKEWITNFLEYAAQQNIEAGNAKRRTFVKQVLEEER